LTATCTGSRLRTGTPWATTPPPNHNYGEQDEDARPEVANLPDPIERYDTVLLGSPVWGSRTPVIMSTLCSSPDFTGTKVIPSSPYVVSGLGQAQQT